MAGYQFELDEAVVLRAQDVGREDGAKALSMFKNAELLLTNKNIVYPRKNMFGKIKDYEVHPLSDIRIVDGDNMGDMAGRILGSFNNALNRKRAQGAPVVAHRCPSHNASLEGKRGSTVVCPYCESNVTIP